ncbi:MAG TPA: hypothetical protein VLA89_17580 [Gemmatimonadales bacterium]|nr:hypothetical protein [Gemmatimonadales bacterium]
MEQPTEAQLREMPREELDALISEQERGMDEFHSAEELAPEAEPFETDEAPQTITAWQYLMNTIIEARSVAQAISNGEPSREASLVVTKLDEAGLWLSTLDPARREAPKPVDPSAADGADIWTPPGAGKLEVVGDPGIE